MASPAPARLARPQRSRSRGVRRCRNKRCIRATCNRRRLSWPALGSSHLDACKAMLIHPAIGEWSPSRRVLDELFGHAHDDGHCAGPAHWRGHAAG
ncbi:hypothetical protein XarjCFBP7652_20355 [Xanthomonas arboricola]|nr:hypothetical protein XarbCFBP7629_06790 [Xanthomonas arboricola]PPT45623.1 hypothetical protein XarjCFBP7652_20355 [Xanthomonas arboricola]